MALQAANRQLTGLRPVNNGVAGTTPRVREYAVSATYATTIGEGNVVSKSTIGVIAYNGTNAVRVIVGVAASNLKASPGTGAVIQVYDDPDQEFVAVGNTAVTAANAIAYVGRFCNLVSNVYNGTLGYGKTTIAVDSVTSVAAAGEILQIVRVEKIVGNTNTSSFTQFRVKIASHHHIYSSALTTRI